MAKKSARKATAKKVSAKKVAKKATSARKTAPKTPRKAAKKAVKKVAKKAATAGSVKKSGVKKARTKKVASTDGPKVVERSKVDSKATPIVFSLDDVEAVLKNRKEEQPESSNGKAPKKKAAPKKAAGKAVAEVEPVVETRKLGAASLADILGFNPNAARKDTTLNQDNVPKKWKKYYNLLIELRNHVKAELDLHTQDTLKHSSKDDAGDLSGYGQHQADAGTDTFDRDFALSLVSSEQEALNEIEEAILRIQDGTYGVCEVTNQPIKKERLEAVPFTRFSIEGQSEFERNKRRKINRGGIFAESASDASQFTANDDGDE